MIKNQYGAGSEVYTLATDDSFRRFYHYYTRTWHSSAPIRAKPPYPRRRIGETFEAATEPGMQDPFIPGDMLRVTDKQVMLAGGGNRGGTEDGDSVTSLRR